MKKTGFTIGLFTVLAATSGWLALSSASAEPFRLGSLGELSPAELAQEFDSMPDDDRADSDLLPSEPAPSANPFFLLDRSPRSPIKDGIPLFPAEWPTEDVQSVIVYVDKDEDSDEPSQRLKLKVNGEIVPNGIWYVSTGILPDHRTPDYEDRPILKMVYNYWSRKYDAPMNWSVFITPGIAIHATPASNYSRLGKPASHGCIRQTETKAYWLYQYLKKFRSVTRIHVL
jgi:hypothetical protein